jgi:hypothetical protein
MKAKHGQVHILRISMNIAGDLPPGFRTSRLCRQHLFGRARRGTHGARLVCRTQARVGQQEVTPIIFHTLPQSKREYILYISTSVTVVIVCAFTLSFSGHKHITDDVRSESAFFTLAIAISTEHP